MPLKIITYLKLGEDHVLLSFNDFERLKEVYLKKYPKSRMIQKEEEENMIGLVAMPSNQVIGWVV